MLNSWGHNELIPVRADYLRGLLAEFDRIMACNEQGDRLVVTLQAEIKMLRARRA